MKRKFNKKVLCLVGGALAVVVVTTTAVLIVKNNGEEEAVVYRETTVEHGDLTVGVTEDSSVSIGTLEQNFDLDISALVSSSSSSSSSSSGNSGFFGNMMDFSGGSSGYSSEDQEMEVESVNITVGQKVEAGDVLYTLTQDSVDEIRTQLEEDIDETLAEYNSLQVEQQESRTSAKQSYDTYVLNGQLASLEYQYDIEDLQDAVDEAQEKIDEINEEIEENNEDYVTYANELISAQDDLKEAEYAVELAYETRFENAYDYVVLKLSLESAKDIVEDLEDKIEELVDNNDTLQTNLASAQRSYNEAVRALETGKLTASQTLDTDTYYASVASTWYNLQIESLDNEVQSIYSSYEDAVEKLDEFDAYIVGNEVIAEYSGVITEVPLEVGDTVTKNTTLVVMYDQDEVTMDVTISEDDYESLDLDCNVNISLDAYSDDIYTGSITEVSDATYDSSTATVYYTLTVTIAGDVSGLYEGMTGEVTFVTKETKEVTYVSNRAIYRDGTRSYVKVYNDNGKVVEKDVVTGFSDGVNVEIVEGLSEGDVVLIESKVSE